MPEIGLFYMASEITVVKGELLRLCFVLDLSLEDDVLVLLCKAMWSRLPVYWCGGIEN